MAHVQLTGLEVHALALPIPVVLLKRGAAAAIETARRSALHLARIMQVYHALEDAGMGMQDWIMSTCQRLQNVTGLEVQSL